VQEDAIAAERPGGWRRRIARVLDTRRGGATHVDALDGIRGIAVAAVFFVHYQPWIGHYLPDGRMLELGARIADVGNAGVDLFFVLSGYLIYGALLRRPQPFGRFMSRRLQRIYPTFLVVFVPVLLIELARGAPQLQQGPGFLPNLLGNVLLLAGVLPIDPLIVVAWTLSYELFFYLLTPLLFRVARLRGRPPGQRLAIVAAVWVVACIPGTIADVGNARMLMFLGGVVVAEWVVARSGSVTAGAVPRATARLGLAAAVVAPVACFALTWGGRLTPDDDGVVEVTYGAHSWALWVRLAVLLLTLPLVVAALVDGRGALARFTSRPALRSLGTMSYSYYLLHALVIRVLGEVALKVVDPAGHQSAWWWWVALVPVFAATVAGSFVLFAAVERPCSIDPDPPVTVLPPRIVRWPWQRRLA
jgi:peptidoglycan/LPS O-acetylase OafA/YrhL